MSRHRTVAAPGLFTALIDDAAVFPPGSAPLARALDAHRQLRKSSAGPFIGPLLVPDSAVPELLELLELLDLLDEPAEALPIGVISSAGDIDGLLAATQLCSAQRAVHLSGVEIAAAGRPVDGVIDALTPLLVGMADPEVQISIEIARHRPDQLADIARRRQELSAGRLRGKFRTGGLDAGSIPSAQELSQVLTEAVRRQLPIKLTAGLHHAVRTGDQHGVLNVLLAVDAAFEQPESVTGWLLQTDSEPMTAVLGCWDEIRTARTRSVFTSFGCCGVLEPLAEAAALAVISAATKDSSPPHQERR